MGKFLLTLLLCYFVTLSLVSAEECDNPGGLSDTAVISGCISKYGGILDAIAKANTTNRQTLQTLQKQISNLKFQISSLGVRLAELGEDIFEREVRVGVKQALLAAKVRQNYIRKKEQPALLLLFSSRTAADFFRDVAYRERLAREDQEIIVEVGEEIRSLNDQASNLKSQKDNLDVLRKRVDKQADWLAGEVEKASKYEADLSGKIAALSARQQQILAERSGSFVVDVGDSELADDYNASIKGFRESAPAGSFAVFSFGAYTHRKGMSQYGARGRVAAGQNYRDISRAYYGRDVTRVETGGNIRVAGYGSMDFEAKYLYGIAEMPSNWPKEALKVQAVAARSYAIRYKQQNLEICTSEACQVFRKSKADNPPEAWKQAVDETRGEVVEGVVTYYSSTTGGYITTSGWDTTDGGGGGNFFEKTYEKKGGSPWAYKAWYTKGYSPDSDKCGRGNPWLNNEEFADLVNAALVARSGNSGETERVTPISSCWGGNPYSTEQLRQVADKYGGVSRVESVTVNQGNGNTNEVIINGNIQISGSDFRKGFNLRAPGRLSIPQSGFSFFNVERK